MNKSNDWSKIKVVIQLSVFMLMIFIFAFTLALDRDLKEPNCDFLACQYKDKVTPSLNNIGLVLFLPLLLVKFLMYLSKPFSTILAILLLLVLVLYWYFLGWLVAQIVSLIRFLLIKGKPIKSYLKNKLEKWRAKNPKLEPMHTSLLICFMVILFSIFFGVHAFLYYPRTKASIDYQDYLLISTVIIGVVVFFTKDSGLNVDVKSKRSFIALALFSVFIMIMGAFHSFIFNIATSRAMKEVELAQTNALQVGLLTGGLTGLFALFILTAYYKYPKKKKNKKSKKD